jgi:hypothetical protein
MNDPLSLLWITFQEGRRDQILDCLHSFADDNRFNIRLSADSGRPSDIFIQMYRTDIKMIGHLPKNGLRLDLTVFRTASPVPVEEVRKGIDALRRTVLTVPETNLEETVFERGDVMPKEKTPILPIHVAVVHYRKNESGALEHQIFSYAEDNGFAIRSIRGTPDPLDISFTMFREDLFVLGIANNEELRVAFYRSGDATASAAVVDQAFEGFAHATERVPSVRFRNITR